MTMFKKLLAGSSAAKSGTPETVIVGDANVGVLLASAAHSEAVAQIHAGEVEGVKIQLELDVMDETVARIDSALAGIQDTSIGGGAAPSLSTESLNILDRTLLTDVGVVSTGMESSSSLGPVETTAEVVLGLESVMADAGKAIKETFYKFIDWITLQFGKIFGGFEKTKAKAAAIKKKADAFEGSLSKDNVKVHLRSLVKGNVDKTITTSLASDITDLATLTTKTVSDLEVSAEAMVEAADTAIGHSKEDWAGDEAAKGFGLVVAKWKDVVAKAVDLIPDVDNGTPIIGGRNITKLSEDVTTDAGAVPVPAKLILNIKSPVKPVEDKEIAPLPIAKIIDVCDAIIDACDSMIASRKKMVDSKAFKSKFGKIADASDKLSADKDYNASQADIRTTTKIARTAGMIANGSFRHKLALVLMDVSSASLAYADKSIKKA